MKVLRLRATLQALFCLVPVAALGQSTVYTLPESVVTVSRSEQLLTSALPHTSVIGRAQIERSQAVDLPSLLAVEAGFQFTQSGGRGTASNLFLRGSAALQVLLLIDGVPMTKQDTTGTVSLEHIMLDQVERVEIVRGNVSAIYGSGAIGGVIQVFTRQGQGKPAAVAQFEAGSQGSARARLGFSGQVGETRFSLGVGRHVTQGISSMDGGQFPNENPDLDGYRNSNYNVALSHDLAKGQRLGLRAYGSDGRFEFDGGGFGGPTDIHRGRAEIGNWSLYSHNQIRSDWRSELTFSQGRESAIYDARLTAFPYDSEAVTRTRTLTWNNIILLGDWQLSAGLERQRQRIDASDSNPTQLVRERSVSALFGGLAGSWGASGAHSMQFNLRRDNTEGLPVKTTAYAGYGFKLTEDWKLIASASSAFNVPPLGYLYDLFSGNPALQPETARSAELGLQWAKDGQVVRATLFNTRIDNLLQYDFATFTFNNVSDASNKGLELSYTGKALGASLRASLTLQDPRDESTGQRLMRRARVMAALGASMPLGPWILGADLRYTGSRTDTPGNPMLPGYVLANASARYALTPQVVLTARVDNLFDQRYQTAYGYNQLGRGVFVGVVWTQK
jgi:vitamin B12 transporter